MCRHSPRRVTNPERNPVCSRDRRPAPGGFRNAGATLPMTSNENPRTGGHKHSKRRGRGYHTVPKRGLFGTVRIKEPKLQGGNSRDGANTTHTDVGRTVAASDEAPVEADNPHQVGDTCNRRRRPVSTQRTTESRRPVSPSGARSGNGLTADAGIQIPASLAEAFIGDAARPTRFGRGATTYERPKLADRGQVP